MSEPVGVITKINGKSYIIDKHLKSGGFGDVYLVSLQSDRTKKYVVKKAKEHETALNLFLLEVEYDRIFELNLKKCPHIVQVDGFIRGINNDNKEYAMMLEEYAEGGDLFSYIEKVQRNTSLRLNVEKLYKYVFQLVTSVECFHNNHIYNMDIKLENIVFTDKDRTNLAIIDFGLSKKDNFDICTDGSGTVDYQPPELKQGRSEDYKNVTYDGSPFTCSKVDIYSLGKVFNYLEGITSFVNNIKIKEEFKDLINNMLKSDPKERFTISQIKDSDFFKNHWDLA